MLYAQVWNEGGAATPATYLLWPNHRDLFDCATRILNTLSHGQQGTHARGSEAWKQCVRESLETRAALFRDIAGNPFRPVAFGLAWRTSTAFGLAQAMYDARDFAAMPILADALQDASCEDEAILGHCRGDGPHVRGCWAVDLVLGKT